MDLCKLQQLKGEGMVLEAAGGAIGAEGVADPAEGFTAPFDSLAERQQQQQAMEGQEFDTAAPGGLGGMQHGGGSGGLVPGGLMAALMHANKRPSGEALEEEPAAKRASAGLDEAA